MIPDGWVAVVVAVGLLHLFGVAYLLRRRATTGPAEPTGAEPTDPEQQRVGAREAGEVRCRQCGATNDADYRFCRYCVAELPRVPPGGAGVATVAGRGI